jgi:hypothetical protein
VVTDRPHGPKLRTRSVWLSDSKVQYHEMVAMVNSRFWCSVMEYSHERHHFQMEVQMKIPLLTKQHRMKLKHARIQGKAFCSGCKIELPKGFKVSYCKTCKWLWNLQRKYGITFPELRDLLERQGYKCAICGDPFTPDSMPRVDHKGKKIRGLLCNCCNLGVGIFRDNPHALAKAAMYISLSFPQSN